ncbi:MAG TPA: hypothetical protein VK141_08470, partial [Nitrosomonas sp.]|nr:hypothetical protein [Nitrosomonas sp.]
MARKTEVTTATGQLAANIPLELQLRRAVMSCLLWEDSFYESGESIATRIHFLIDHVDDKTVANMAIEARNQQKLRHVPLWLAKGLAHNRSPLTAKVLETVIQRPDELVEFLNQYWFGGKTPLSAQVKKGLAKAFVKFDEYQLAKWN